MSEEIQSKLSDVTKAKTIDVAELQKLLDAKADPNVAVKSTGTPDEKSHLFLAADKGNADAVKALLAAGGNKDAPDVFGTTPLMASVVQNHNEVSQILIDAKADVNAQQPEAWGGFTAIIHASQKGNAVLLSALLKAKANPNLQHNRMGPAVNCCVSSMESTPEVLQMLIDAGADVNCRDKSGKSALDVAKTKQDKDFAEKLEKASSWFPNIFQDVGGCCSKR